jgi:hypothetical protein
MYVKTVKSPTDKQTTSVIGVKNRFKRMRNWKGIEIDFYGQAKVSCHTFENTTKYSNIIAIMYFKSQA